MSDKVNKIDIAIAHIQAAIQMIATRINPYTVHLPVMASDEIIVSIAGKNGVQLDYDSKIWIKSDFQAEWNRKRKAAYNYFKHADKDYDKNYDGPNFADLQFINEGMLMLSITGLIALKVDYPRFFNVFVVASGAFYPELIDWERMIQQFPILRDGYQQAVGKVDRRTFENVLRIYLSQVGILDLGM